MSDPSREQKPLPAEETEGEQAPTERAPRDDVQAASSLIAEVEAYQRRIEEARRRGNNSLWAQVAYVGALGWMIALPIAGGAMFGHYLDRRLGSGIAWTLSGMSLGLIIAGYFVWRVVFSEQGNKT